MDFHRTPFFKARNFITAHPLPCHRFQIGRTIVDIMIPDTRSRKEHFSVYCLIGPESSILCTLLRGPISEGITLANCPTTPKHQKFPISLSTPQIPNSSHPVNPPTQTPPSPFFSITTTPVPPPRPPTLPQRPSPRAPSSVPAPSHPL